MLSSLDGEEFSRLRFSEASPVMVDFNEMEFEDEA